VAEKKPVCCARLDVRVQRAHGDLAALARKANRKNSTVTPEMIQEAKAEVLREKEKRAWHLRTEHGVEEEGES
jgi:hypothetical protein